VLHHSTPLHNIRSKAKHLQTTMYRAAALTGTLGSLMGMAGAYDPTWASLDTRPLPEWYDQAKVGIFIHWGVFSVPSFKSEWYWYMLESRDEEVEAFHNRTYGSDFPYSEFMPSFTAELWNATQWAEIFQASGAKYVVLTSKHHEGFTMWPSTTSYQWNAGAGGPNRDLVGEFAQAIRETTDLTFGLYHSLFEWFNPEYLADKANNFNTSTFVDSKVMPELYELVNTYKPDVIWSDGDWETDSEYWRSKEFLAWLYTDSPVKDTVITNDRWGTDAECAHGVNTCTDRYNPGSLQPDKWENAFTIDATSWGLAREHGLETYLSMTEILTQLVSTVACGGNALINVGPAADGTIHPIFEERLRALGRFLAVSGEGIYKSVPWRAQNDTAASTWYTAAATAEGEGKAAGTQVVYAHVLEWPSDNVLTLSEPVVDPASTTIQLLGGSGGDLSFTALPSGVSVELPLSKAIMEMDAWTIKINGAS